MSRKCPLTGKGVMSGHNVSFSKRRTNRRFEPNLQNTTIFVPELNRSLHLRLSTSAIRTLRKKGLMQFLRDEGMTIKDIL